MGNHQSAAHRSRRKAGPGPRPAESGNPNSTNVEERQAAIRGAGEQRAEDPTRDSRAGRASANLPRPSEDLASVPSVGRRGQAPGEGDVAYAQALVCLQARDGWRGSTDGEGARWLESSGDG